MLHPEHTNGTRSPALAATRTLLDTALTALLLAALPGAESPAVAYRCVRCSVPAGAGTDPSGDSPFLRTAPVDADRHVTTWPCAVGSQLSAVIELLTPERRML